MLDLKKYKRKELIVSAVEITDENMEEVAEWCRGRIQLDENKERRIVGMKVFHPVNKRQTQGYVGDFMVKLNGFKVYEPKSLNNMFDPYEKPDEVLDGNDSDTVLDGGNSAEEAVGS